MHTNPLPPWHQHRHRESSIITHAPQLLPVAPASPLRRYRSEFPLCTDTIRSGPCGERGPPLGLRALSAAMSPAWFTIA